MLQSFMGEVYIISWFEQMRKSLILKAIDNDKKAENVQNVLRFSFLFA